MFLRRQTSTYNDENTTAAIKIDFPSEQHSLSSQINALKKAIEDVVEKLPESPLFDTLEKRSLFVILLDQLIKSDTFQNTMWQRRDLSVEDRCRSQATMKPQGTQVFIFSFLFLIIRLRHTKQPYSIQLIIASVLCAVCFFDMAFSQMR